MIRRTQQVVGDRRRFDFSRRVRRVDVRRRCFLPQVQQRIILHIVQMFRLPVLIKFVKTFELFRRQTFVMLTRRSPRSGPMKVKGRAMLRLPSERLRVQMTIILFDIRHFHRGLIRFRLISKRCEVKRKLLPVVLRRYLSRNRGFFLNFERIRAVIGPS